MAITVVSSRTDGSSTLNLSSMSYEEGDLLIVFAYRDGSTTAPSYDTTSFTNIYSGGANTNSHRIVSRVLTDGSGEENWIFGDATMVVGVILRGDQPISTGAHLQGGGASTTLSYNGITLQDTSGNSRVLGFGGHRSTDVSIETAPSGMTNLTFFSNTTCAAAGHITTGTVTSWSTQTASVGGTSSGWRTHVLEIKEEAANVDLTLTATGGSLTVTDTDANLLRGRRLEALGGTLTVSDTVANLLRGRRLTALGGSLTITDTDVTLSVGTPARTLSADGGTLTVSDTPAALVLGRRMSADGGALAVSDTAVTLQLALASETARYGYLRTELWTNLVCAGGQALAILGGGYWRAPRVSRTVRGDASCVIEGDARWPRLAELMLGRVLRIQMANGDFSEWRIRDVDLVNDGPAQRVTVTADHPQADLLRIPWSEVDASGVPYYQLLMAGTTAELVVDGELLPAASAAGFTWISKGTIEPTQEFDLDVADANVQSILTAIQEPSRAPCEIELRRVGTTGYALDLVNSIGASADPLYVRTARNLQRGQRALRGADALTRARGKGADNGAHPGLAFCYWIVSAVDTTADTVELEDPRGSAYPGPIGFDDQLNGLRVARLVSTYADVEVLDSSASAQTITVADASPFSVGDLVEFRGATGISGERVSTLKNPAAEALYGVYSRLVQRDLISCAVNYAPNPWFSTWSTAASPPDGWSVEYEDSITRSRETAEGRFGPYAWRFVSTMGSAGWQVNSPTFRPFTSGSYNFWMWIYVVGADLQYAGGSYSDPILTFAIRDASTDAVLHEVDFNLVDGGGPDLIGVDQWLKLEIGAPDLSSATNGVYLSVEFSSASAIWTLNMLLDAVGCAPAINGTVDAEGPSANDLWHACNAALLSAWPAEWRVSILDLETLDGSRFPTDKVTLGQLVYITDTQLGLTTTQRLLGYTQDFDPDSPTMELELGRLQATLTDILAPRPALPIGAIARQIAEQLSAVLPDAAPAEQETLGTVVVGLRSAFRTIT